MTTDLHVTHNETDHRGAFTIFQDGERLAEMTYSKAGTKRIIADHTEVGERLRGQGAGMALLRALADHARQNNLKVLATCPFVLAMFEKHDEFDDIRD